MSGSSVAGRLMGWEQCVGTVIHHEGGKIVHEGICLNMQVSEHLVPAPVSDQFGNVGVNAGA